MITALFFILGLVLLVAGAEWLVGGSASVARRFGIPPLVIGLTIVAFGTSAPEMAVSAKASLAGQGELALGNLIGSNIFNILFILGISALVTPLVVARQIIRIEVPLVIGFTLLLIYMGSDGVITWGEGAVLLGAIVVYTIAQGIGASLSGDAGADENPAKPMAIGKAMMLIALGLTFLVLGARFLVDSAVEIARHFGVSEVVIGLTVVAAGTSLPEVATSVMASIRGQRDIAVGNVMGSNIFNLLAVGGIAGILSPAPLAISDHLLWVDLPVALAAAAVCIPIFVSGATISRREGALFLVFFLFYNSYIVLSATDHDWVGPLAVLFSWALIPATMLVLSETLREHRREVMGQLDQLRWKQRRQLRMQLVTLQKHTLRFAGVVLALPLIIMATGLVQGRYLVPLTIVIVIVFWYVVRGRLLALRRASGRRVRRDGMTPVRDEEVHRRHPLEP